MKRILTLGAATLFLLTACGSSSPGGGQPVAQDSGAAVAGGGDAAPGTEGAVVRYTNATFHYRVDAPGAMKEQADGSAAYLGASERLEISVVTGASAADPAALARGDLPGLGAKPAYLVVNQLARATISGRAVEKVVYTWTDGVNSVTGKANNLVAARYYIPRDNATLAVVTYSIVANRYDPQGADDVVSTFAWL